MARLILSALRNYVVGMYSSRVELRRLRTVYIVDVTLISSLLAPIYPPSFSNMPEPQCSKKLVEAHLV